MRLSHGPALLRWAIIPTAGRGSRLRPAAAAVPKVLLPVGLRPMLDWALDEALAAGATDIVVIASPRHPEVAAYAAKRAAADDWPTTATLRVVEQPEPQGLGEALLRCRDLTGDEPFGVVVPDNWFDAEVPPLAQVAQTRARTGLDAIGLVRVTPASASLLGNVGRVALRPIEGDDFRIVELGDKRSGTFALEAGEGTLRGCARYALGPGFYDALEATGPPPSGEWDDVPAFQHLIGTVGLAGRRLDAVHFDVGNQGGYLAAMSYLFERRLSDSRE